MGTGSVTYVTVLTEWRFNLKTASQICPSSSMTATCFKVLLYTLDGDNETATDF